MNNGIKEELRNQKGNPTGAGDPARLLAVRSYHRAAAAQKRIVRVSAPFPRPSPPAFPLICGDRKHHVRSIPRTSAFFRLIPGNSQAGLARQTGCNGLIDPQKIKVNQGGSSSIKVNQGILQHFFMQNSNLRNIKPMSFRPRMDTDQIPKQNKPKPLANNEMEEQHEEQFIQPILYMQTLSKSVTAI